MTPIRRPLAAALLATPLLATAAPVTYEIDPSHTSVTYETLHFGTSTNRGRFMKTSGKVVVDRAARSGTVDLVLEVGSVSSGVAPLDTHLKSADFFDVASHPTARFVGERFVFDGEQVAEVAGQLTLRGKTHPVTLKAQRFNCYDNAMFKREVCGGDFEATVRRSQWGVDWGLQMGFPDETRLLIQVEAIRQ